jgi:hypothetical protein
MDLAESLKLERYKFVTDRQKYFTELARDAFASYARFFAALVAAGLALVSSRETLGIRTEILLYLVHSVLYLGGFLAIVASIQIVFCLWRWYGYRKAELKINPDSPSIDRVWWVFETLYILAIWGAFVGSCIVVHNLPALLHTSLQGGKQ